MKKRFGYFLASILILSQCTIFESRVSVETSVLVVGGGVSGVSSALQAARMGEKVIIVEESSWLGGTLTTAGVSEINGNNKLTSGIWGELVDKLAEHYGSKEAMMTGWGATMQFEPSIGKNIIEQFILEEPNITVYKGYWIEDVIKVGNSLDRVIFKNDENVWLEVKAKQFIEATEYGDLLAKSGESYSIGLESKDETGEADAPKEAFHFIQDLTYIALVNDLGNGKDNLISEPDNYNASLFNCVCLEVCKDSKEALSRIDCQKMLEFGKLPNHKYLLNWSNNGNNYFSNILELSRKERLSELEKAKEHTLAWIYFLQKEAGLTQISLENEFGTKDKFALIPFLRESRRIKAEIILNLNDVLEPYKNELKPIYKAGIAVSDAPLDQVRSAKNTPKDINYAKIPSFSIPLTSLMAEKTNNLIIAEKSISVTSLVNGSSNNSATRIGIGQAAGVLAVTSITEKTYPRKVNIRQIQQVLLDYGCWLMPFLDVRPDNEYFQEVQRVATSGLMRGEGKPAIIANETWFYPDSLASSSDFKHALQALGYDLEIPFSSKITRGELLVHLWTALEKPGTSPIDLDYDDVKRNSEVYKALIYFISEDLNSIWYEEDKLGINIPVKRWELAVWLDKVFEPYNSELYLSTFLQNE